MSYHGIDARKGRPYAAVDGAMKFRDTPEMSGKPARRVAKTPKSDSSGLDEWVKKRLHDVYDPVLKEEIPDDLTKLLDDFAKRPAGKSDTGSNE